VNEEKQNQLRWQVKLGDAAATFEQQAKVLEHRIVDWKIYKVRTKNCTFVYVINYKY